MISSTGDEGVRRRARVVAVSVAALIPFLAPAGAAGQPPTAAEYREADARAAQALGPAPRLAVRASAVPLEPAPGFADSLTVALYGSPQLTATAVGKRSPVGAAKMLRKQANAYRELTELPVTRSINLIGVTALASPGSDGLYRARQSRRVIRHYLAAARSIGARLTLDVQPGRSPLIKELRALRPWLARPDVDLGIDPEWNVGTRGIPGRTEGWISHRELNHASRWLQRFARERELPPKLMVVHQFRAGSIVRRGRVKPRRRVAVTLNFDGIGSPSAKRAGYQALFYPDLLGGFSLFYVRDSPLMAPHAVLGLQPQPRYVMYQ